MPAFIILILLVLSSCANDPAVRGHWLEEDVVAKLQPGKQTKADVVQLLGSPSTVSTFQPNIWFYIGQRQQQRAFLEREVLDQQVLGLSFDDVNVLQAVVRRGRDAYSDIEPISRATPTAGKQLTILEQLVGNVGRFNK